MIKIIILIGLIISIINTILFIVDPSANSLPMWTYTTAIAFLFAALLVKELEDEYK